jgi:hypothetical protein
MEGRKAREPWILRWPPPSTGSVGWRTTEARALPLSVGEGKSSADEEVFRLLLPGHFVRKFSRDSRLLRMVMARMAANLRRNRLARGGVDRSRRPRKDLLDAQRCTLDVGVEEAAVEGRVASFL